MTFTEKMKDPLVSHMAVLLDTTVEELIFTLAQTYNPATLSDRPSYLANLLFLAHDKLEPGHAYMPNCIAALEAYKEVVDLRTYCLCEDKLLARVMDEPAPRGDMIDALVKAWDEIFPGESQRAIAMTVVNSRSVRTMDEFNRLLPDLIADCHSGKEKSDR